MPREYLFTCDRCGEKKTNNDSIVPDNWLKIEATWSDFNIYSLKSRLREEMFLCRNCTVNLLTAPPKEG